jgi:virginiamycin B lyase
MKATRKACLALGFGMLICGIAFAKTFSARRLQSSDAVSDLKATIRQWDVPSKGGHPQDPLVDSEGSLWFTEQAANKIGHLNPKTGEFKEYALPGEKKAGPQGIAADQRGNIWFTANTAAYIGKLDPSSGKVTVFNMPDPQAGDPHSLAFDSSGILWFTVKNANMVGKLDPASGQITLKEAPSKRALPFGIQVLKRGIPVFCESGTNKLGAIDPTTLRIQELFLPPTVRARRLVVGPDDNVIFFTDYRDGNIGKMETSIGATVLFASPGGPESDPEGLTIAPDGMVWYAESGLEPNNVVRFNPTTSSFAKVPIPAGGGTVGSMVAAPDGRVFFTSRDVDKVGVVEVTK